MASSFGAALVNKGAMVVAVWVVLFHSSTGQQPPVPVPALAPAPPPTPPSPPPPYCSNCSSTCTQTCEHTIRSNRASYCSTTVVPDLIYKGCLENCANSTCHGHYSHGGLGCCSIGTCTPQHCGNPCVQDCCKSCTANAHDAYEGCLGSSIMENGMANCMAYCMDGCKHYCITQ